MFKDLYLADPGYLIIFIIIPFTILFWYKYGKLTQATLRYSSLSLLKFNRSLISRLRPILYILRILAIIFIVIALSRPQSESTSKRIKSSMRMLERISLGCLGAAGREERKTCFSPSMRTEESCLMRCSAPRASSGSIRKVQNRCDGRSTEMRSYRRRGQERCLRLIREKRSP